MSTKLLRPDGLAEIDRTAIGLVGTLCEIRWSSTNAMAKRQCEKCVYLVRGEGNGLTCVQLIYDAIDGIQPDHMLYWVPNEAIQYMKILSVAQAHARIEALEREVYSGLPRD